jgi:tRNA U34 5-carboxymethylaminomethyl modifying enzyme MnmG/GidA
MIFTEHFDVVVVGAGHAGCEAAMAAARMGLKTALYTLNVDLIAQMSCNPAVGGIAKGHLVREVDALGGIMGEVTDAVGIQFRLLNTSRGPAVWSPRAQCDKQAYRLKMREVLESQPNLKIKQAEVADLIVELCHPERSEAQPNEVEGPAVSPQRANHQPTANDLSAAIGQSCAQLLKRPEITIEHLAPALRELDPAFFEREEIRINPRESVAALSSEVRNELKSIETEIKYEGYLLQQQRAIERLKKAEQRAIPDWFDYHTVSGLSREVQETLLKMRPRTLAHASRIPGVTPAAVSLVHVYIEIQAKRRQQVAAL